MSEKSLRQVGEESQQIYSRFKDVESEAKAANYAIQYYTDEAQVEDSIVRAIKNGKTVFSPRKNYQVSKFYGHRLGRYSHIDDSVESHEKNRDDSLRIVGKSVLSAGVLLDDENDQLKKAAQHFKRNAASYYDLAVLEARMDGVDINVSQERSNPADEQIEVKAQ